MPINNRLSPKELKCVVISNFISQIILLVQKSIIKTESSKFEIPEIPRKSSKIFDSVKNLHFRTVVVFSCKHQKRC